MTPRWVKKVVDDHLNITVTQPKCECLTFYTLMLDDSHKVVQGCRKDEEQFLTSQKLWKLYKWISFHDKDIAELKMCFSQTHIVIKHL